MEVSRRSKPIFLHIILQFCFFSLLSSALSISTGNDDGYTINGQVKITGVAAKGFGLPVKVTNAKVILNGGPTSYFSQARWIFFIVRVDVSARNPGKVQAALTENKRGLSELVLEPLRDEQYYEIREPFNVISLVKSPMGLMVGFMLIVMFLMPKLVENMDPEEMKRAQEEMRNQGVPSIANLLPGAARRN